MLAADGDRALRVIVVWEPVIASDQGPPSSRALARLGDPRAVQLWDPERRLSEEILRLAREHPDLLSAEERAGLEESGVAWDLMMLWPRGARWAEHAAPVYHRFPVVRGRDELGARLAAVAPAP